jgi:hypothetical protein
MGKNLDIQAQTFWTVSAIADCHTTREAGGAGSGSPAVDHHRHRDDDRRVPAGSGASRHFDQHLRNFAYAQIEPAALFRNQALLQLS